MTWCPEDGGEMRAVCEHYDACYSCLKCFSHWEYVAGAYHLTASADCIVHNDCNTCLSDVLVSQPVPPQVRTKLELWQDGDSVFIGRAGGSGGPVAVILSGDIETKWQWGLDIQKAYDTYLESGKDWDSNVSKSVS